MAYSDFLDHAVDLWSDFAFQWRHEHAADLNRQKSGYFSWWLETMREKSFSCETLQEFKDFVESVAVLADAELDVIREISDMAIEMRWMRKLQCHNSGLVSAYL